MVSSQFFSLTIVTFSSGTASSHILHIVECDTKLRTTSDNVSG